MPRLERILIENGVYHTISATRGRQPILANTRAAESVVDAINASRGQGKVLLIAYAVLPDHLHLLCVPLGESTISHVMKAIKGTSGKAINKFGLHAGPVWQQSFYDRVIRDEKLLNVAVEYIHRNPYRCGPRDKSGRVPLLFGACGRVDGC
jgi:REP-associated tyrosine transposase